MTERGKEKKAFLLLYIFALFIAMTVFLYLTKISGYTPKEITKVALLVLLPALFIVFLGGTVILKHHN
ncbi:hypothetical protein [Thermococcus sp.]|uniref:hypothetical protein n=1 Tax=Thermococcus sp. TaxID=35749 RepID=UPI0019B202A9|nr:hypothetical protein [Thermococcus sp.]MBC7095453.1 hypothetical protein [Thermococcus sp.]